jgi:hypothetical protein
MIADARRQSMTAMMIWGFALINKKNILILVVVAVLTYAYIQEQGISIPGFSLWTQSTDNTLQDAYNNRQNGLQVYGEGIVTEILSDDLQGARHQRFIVRLSSGQTLLVAHNIDVAPRINRLRTGYTVAFYGEYEWNSKGGVIHWTHHDPDGRHVDGWLKHDGKTYR